MNQLYDYGVYALLSRGWKNPMGLVTGIQSRLHTQDVGLDAFIDHDKEDL